VYEIVETWTSAKGYSFKEGFGMLLFILGIATFLVSTVMFVFPFTIPGILVRIPFIAFYIGIISFVWYVFRNISNENDWVYRDYLTAIDLYKEMGKDELLRKISKQFRDVGFRFAEVSYDSRFPLQLMKSHMINEKVQLDICYRALPRESSKAILSRYKYLIVLFLGPITHENNTLSKNIQMELDKLLSTNK